MNIQIEQVYQDPAAQKAKGYISKGEAAYSSGDEWFKKAGEVLYQKKKDLGKGKWSGWLKSVGIPKANADRYVRWHLNPGLPRNVIWNHPEEQDENDSHVSQSGKTMLGQNVAPPPPQPDVVNTKEYDPPKTKPTKEELRELLVDRFIELIGAIVVYHEPDEDELIAAVKEAMTRYRSNK